jgi:TonB-dependent starch-binding outer membrane protein SusC
MKCFFTMGKHLQMLMLLLCLLCSCILMAQKKVTGKVIDKKTNTAMTGVSVQEKGTRNGTTTTADGSFSISVTSAKPVLVITMVGFAPQEIPVGDKTSVDVSMEEKENALEDVVVIGYQTVQRRFTTAAVATVKGKDFENTPYPTFESMLQGRVAGLTVLNVSGEPGVNSIVNIRGSSAVNDANGNLTGAGTSTPLYVIDGVVFDVSDVRTAYGNSNPLVAINPNDIESIDVLKDASAAAIYGARAANGVIIIKTKRPKSGRPQFRVSGYVGLNTRPSLRPVTVGAGERRMKYDLIAQQNNYVSMGTMSQVLTDSLNPAFNNNTDFQNLMFRDAIIQNYDMSIAGAEEKYAYRIALNGYIEEGVARGFDLKRITPRIFFSLKPYKGVEVTSDIYFGLSKTTHGTGNNGGQPFPFGVQNFPSSFWRLDEVNKAAYQGRNAAVRDDDRNTSVNGNTRAIIKFTPAITFTSSFSFNLAFNRRDYLQPRNITGNTSNAINFNSNSRRWELENYLTYAKSFGDHSFTALAGQGAEDNVNQVTNLRANGIPLDAIFTVNGVAPGPNLTGNSSFQERTRVSMFTRVGYSFKERYGVDFSYRRDASSRYSPNSRWGEFPAASIRWNASEEPWFEPFNKYVNFLKIRGSYGVTGRDPGDYYAQYRQLGINGSYVSSSLGAGAGSNVVTYNGITAIRPNYTSPAPATEITWERAPQWNVGFDASFMNSRFSLTMDFYQRNSQDLIFSVPVPITTGYTTAINNYVDVRNQGFEVTLWSNNLSKKSAFQWNTQLNFAFNNNFVTKLPSNNRDFVYGPSFFQRVLTVGQPLHTFVVWNVPFVYPTREDVPVDPLTGTRIRNEGSNNFYGGGDGAKQDLNGDYNITILDKVVGGDPSPRIAGGFINNFSYKGFSVQVLTSFIFKRKLWNSYLSDKLASATNDLYANWGRFSGPAVEFQNLNIWRQPGDIADIPNIFSNAVDNTNISNGYFVQNASFFRLKNILLSYMLPQKFVNRLKLKSVRVYSNLDNLAVFYPADVPDPEGVGENGVINGQGYPLSKKFTFGLEINL